MVDVLLTHSYHLYYDRKQVRKMQPYPPLGTLYAAALLREKGFSVAVFDSMLDDPESEFPAALERYHPRIVAIYEDSFNFLTKMCLSRMRTVAYGMIDVARDAGATVVVNGSDATDHVAEFLERGADYAVIGEAEWTLLELAEALVGNADRELAEIRGLAFLRGPDRRLFHAPPRPLLRSLDALPMPARDLVEMGRYRSLWESAHGFFSLNLTASRGCPYRCNWCAKPIYGDSHHSRSAQSVAQEMAILKREYGAEHLWFADDIFGLKPGWVRELAEEVERFDAAVPFKMQSRADLMKPATVQALRRAGCVEAWMGVESGSQEILNAMDKGLRIEQVISARNNLREAAIRACYFLQFGYAGEAWEEIQKTIALVRQTRPDDIGVSVSYPLPGTKFYKRVREQLGAKTNWEDSEDLSMMFQGAYRTEFYRLLHDALHAEVETWSSHGPRKFSLNNSADRLKVEGPQELAALWERVEQMEEVCRNADPTLLPVLACSEAQAV
jgi:radical SAM superfamily enzyme YgiQ (UPF0313 family)